jgi:hypothetical protein
MTHDWSSNFIASISFTEGGDETKIWANKETFAKMGTPQSHRERARERQEGEEL